MKSYSLKGRIILATLVLSSLSTARAETAISETQIERFATAITQIHHYYLKPVSYQKLFDNAIRGMLTSLDPHSDYLSPKDIRDLQDTTRGEYAGIGIEIIPDNGMIKVISPVSDAPADKAGIMPGDIIVKINNKFVKDISSDEAISLIKGPEGTIVELTVVRSELKDSINFKIKRELIKMQSVKSKLYRKKIAYSKISTFGENTAQELKSAVLNFNKSNSISGLVIDLRNNPGGLLTSAIEISDLFLDRMNTRYNGMIVYTKGRLDIDNTEAHATPGDIFNNKPIVILINSGSASASEIVAGALKDQKRAIVLGTRSFGKGSVQTVIPIDYESAIKLTTSLYYTPNGTSIQANGIIPDVYTPYTQITEGKKKTNIETMFENISEQNLSGHLQSPSQKTQKNSMQILEKKQEQAQLAYKDLQLFQALNLVEAMSVRNQTNSGATKWIK